VRLTAEQALAILGKAGVTLTLEGGKLIARPTELVRGDAELLSFIKVYKPILIAHLRDGGRGLCAKWSKHFGYVSIYDPVEGKWYSVATGDAPPWALNEARRRKALWKSGERRAYDLTAADIEEHWQAEQVDSEADEGIVEDHTEDLD